MPLVVKDRVRETSTTAGTGTFTLAGAVLGYQSFSAVGNGNTTYYTIYLQGGNEWEVGIGTYTASGTTLSRDTILASSNGGSIVNFSAGTKDVFVTYPAGRSVWYDTATNVTLNALTLSGGTANGVPYLNGSKVLTSGSALGFNGTDLVIGRDVSAAGGRLTVWKSDGTGNIALWRLYNGTNNPGLILNLNEASNDITFNTAYSVGANPAYVWQQAGSEAMRLNSTGLGIGTNNPGRPLHVAATSGTSYVARFESTGSSLAVINFKGNATGDFTVGVGANGENLVLSTNTTTRATIDSSGNLGIGVTPVANTRVYVRTAATTDTAYYADNGANSGFIVKFASALTSIGNDFNQPFALLTNNTERARITPAGNFGVGTTSPIAFSNQTSVTVNGTNTGRFDLKVGDTHTGALVATSTYVDLTAITNIPLTFGTNSTERARITATGNFLVGTTTNTNSSTIVSNGTISETVGGVQYLVASQADIGTAPNEIPLNQYLGNLAYQDAGSIAGQVGLSAGTAALPSLVSATDTDTGMWFPAANTLAWSTNGTRAMTVDSSQNVGIGTTSISARLEVQAAGVMARFKSGGATDGRVEWAYNTTDVGYVGADAATEFSVVARSGNVLKLGAGGVERARITSGGSLLVGSTSNNARFNVTGGSLPSDGGVSISSSLSAGRLATGNTNNTTGIVNVFNDNGVLELSAGTTNAAFAPAGIVISADGAATANSTLRFFTYAAERARITAGGNVGIGSTSPQAKLNLYGDGTLQILGTANKFASGTGAAAIQFRPLQGEANEAVFGSIQFADDRPNNAAAFAGSIRFATTDGSGNAERARITSGGNFVVGDTSAPARIYSVNTAGFSLGLAGSTKGIRVEHNTTESVIQGVDNTLNVSYQPIMLSGSIVKFGIQGAEKAQLTSGGYLLVGLTSPISSWGSGKAQEIQIAASGQTYPGLSTYSFNTAVSAAGMLVVGRSRSASVGTLTTTQSGDALGYLIFEGVNSSNALVGGAYIQCAQDGAATASNVPGRLMFLTNDGSTIAERARITSGGYFKASNTGSYVGSGSNYHELRTNAADYTAYFTNSNASSPFGFEVTYTVTDPNGTGNRYIGCYASSTQRMEVRSNGGIANYQANDVNLSDRREKTNFAPAKSYLDIICSIPVQTFNYIDQSKDDPGLTLGVVAQDVQAVAPELVSESNWGTEDNPKMRLSIYQTDLQYALMKCIQEQQAMINELKAEVAALKGA